MYLFPYILHGLCEDYLTCDIAFNAVMPLSRASTRGRYSRIEGVTPAHGGFEFLKGSFEGLKGYAVGRMTKSRRGKIYIDDEGWGPDASSIEYGYRVPFGGIHVF